MATGSTASSGTEGPEPQDPREAADAPPVESDGAPSAPLSDSGSAAEPATDESIHDADRRAFFFQFGKQAVSAVGQVAGMADMVGRTSSAMANELLGLDEPEAPVERQEFTRSGQSSDPVVSVAAPAAENAFRSAYRLTEDELVLLDQRGIPDALDEVAARRGSDVAYYLRLGVARGGPLMAQVAAYGLALTAAERADQTSEQRRIELLRTQRALTEARPSARLVAWATERTHAAAAAFAEATPGAEVADVLRAEADAIAADIRDWQASVARTLVEVLPAPEGRPLAVLVHGQQGALSGGTVGTGLTALQRLRDAGRELRIFLTEGRPFMDGARLASWELRQAGLAHQIIPDAAVAWLLDRQPIDAVLLEAERVAANGDTAALIGGGAIARLVSARPDGDGPRVIVSGIRATEDRGSPDGAALPTELRPARELSAYLADVPIRASDALVPATDVVPAGAIDLLVTEVGATTPAEAG